MRWAQEAWAALLALAASGERFTADDLLDRVGPPDDTHAANGSMSTVGTMFARAHRAGLIEVVGTAKSRAPHRKGGLIQVWAGVKVSTLFEVSP